jgi:hypothetical protein
MSKQVFPKLAAGFGKTCSKNEAKSHSLAKPGMAA